MYSYGNCMCIYIYIHVHVHVCTEFLTFSFFPIPIFYSTIHSHSTSLFHHSHSAVLHWDMSPGVGLVSGKRKRGRGSGGRLAHSSYGNTAPGAPVLDGADSASVGGVSVIVAGSNNVEEKPARKKVQNHIRIHICYMFLHTHTQSDAAHPIHVYMYTCTCIYHVQCSAFAIHS